ncbi:MAG: UDP-galactopyranose mutase [Lachnospiraceae bacterium]|nr:UDP-galactopyranose mutase [Lachnospiraceae bacterium]
MAYDYLIVGAGLFGAVFAHEMTVRGKTCLVIDRRDHVGGNVYTKSMNGINVHVYGAHIFHTDNKEVWDYMNRFAEFNNYVNSPIARIHDELYNLPFNMNTFHELWGVITPSQAQMRIRSQIVKPKNGEPENLEEQALSLVGTDIYEKLIKHYTEKQWGRPCNELPASIIKRVPLRFTYDNNYFDSRYQGIPIGGYTPIIKKMLTGCEVKLSTDFKDVAGIPCEKIVYTGPIDELMNYELGHLEYRTLFFETQSLPTLDDFQGNAVVNYTGDEVAYTRIIEHKHFEFGTRNPNIKGTVITREIPVPWTEGAEPYYPINDDTNDALYGRYLVKARAMYANKLILGGRLGNYKYMDMDAVVAAALESARLQP